MIWNLISWLLMNLQFVYFLLPSSLNSLFYEFLWLLGDVSLKLPLILAFVESFHPISKQPNFDEL
jgi:hypothetical protein